MNEKTHHFAVEDAMKYGVHKAILLEHLKFHQRANEGNPDLTIEGKPHAFIRPDTIKKMYGYLKVSSVRRWLRELEDEGVISSCKPEAKDSYHLKYYHVHAIGQNERSNNQSNRSKNDQNERSSILPNMNKPYVSKDRQIFDSFREPEKEKFHQYCSNELSYTDEFIDELYKHCKGNGYFEKWKDWRSMVSKQRIKNWNDEFNNSGASNTPQYWNEIKDEENEFDPVKARQFYEAEPA